MALKRVLDTNAILYLLCGKLAQPLPPAQYFISVISEMELLSYPSLDEPSFNQIRQFLAEVTVLSLNAEIRDLAIGLRRKYMLKLPEAIVVTTALSLRAPLVNTTPSYCMCPA